MYMEKKTNKTSNKTVSAPKTALQKGEKTKEVNKKFLEAKTAKPKSIKVNLSGIKNMKVVPVLLWIFAFILSFALIDFIFQYINNDMSIAIVNGERISMSEYYKELDKAAGAEISETIIENTLIRQKASDNDITVPQEDIDTIITEYKDYIGGDEAFDEELKAQGTSLEEVEYGLETTLMAKELILSEIIIDDATLEQFYDDYKDQLYTTEATTTFEQKYDDIKQVYLDQQFLQLRDSWVEDLKTDAVIQNNFNDKPDYGLFKLTINIVKGLYQMVTNSGNSADSTE